MSFEKNKNKQNLQAFSPRTSNAGDWPDTAACEKKYFKGFLYGGVADIVLRVIEPRLRQELGQSLVIDNRPGAGGVIGDAMVAKAQPDGYTLLFTSSAVNMNMNMNIAIGRNLPYDLERDLLPIANVAWAPMIMVATPSLKYKSVQELVADARANPGKMSYASAGNGSPSHLTVEMFRDKAGIQAVHVPYKGSP